MREETPPLILAEEMKKQFSMPSIDSISYSGMLEIRMSSKIIVPSFDELLYYFKEG